MMAGPAADAAAYRRVIGFWRPRGAGAAFSQWFMSDLTIGGVTYCCAEQYMMAEKARIFGDNDAHASIMATREPGEMQRLGRRVRGFDAARWDAEKYNIVLRATRAKFTGHLEGILTATDGAYLVEVSPYDRIWGVGSQSTVPGTWRGENLLGKALMQVRDEKIAEINRRALQRAGDP